MLSEEVTIGIYPNGELMDVLIVPEGSRYHLFLTRNIEGGSAIKRSTILGDIVIADNDWIYEGDQLTHTSQKEIAAYIFSYPDAEISAQAT